MRNASQSPGSAAVEYRFGFDIGGTFTDLVITGSDGSLHVGKVLTDSKDITRSIVDGFTSMLRSRGISAAQIYQVIAGATTVITNLVIERKGARTALITTRGFRDVIEIGREIRYDVYDLNAEFPVPLVPRELRYEVSERVDSSGAILTPLSEHDIEKAIAEMKTLDVQAIAVCLLHAYANPSHERRIKEMVARLAPEITVAISSEVLGEVREFERTVATALNAYAMPDAKRYLRRIAARLQELGTASTLRIMQSNGGIMTRELAEQMPLRMLESGPAAGALAAAHIARSSGFENVLSFDMGGTTAKACLISNGVPEITTDFEAARVHRFKRGSGLPTRLPVIDLIEIGAGGGSIAHIDRTGLLKVGPHSAGASPGPACYGAGGTEPTVTDAALLLGYLDPSVPLSGAVRLRPDLAERAIKSRIAEPLGIGVNEAAAGIHRVVCEHMASAAKVHAVEKGRDIRQYTLVAFGGAGPLHAREVAGRVGCRDLVVPPHAGVFSAVGLLIAPLKLDAVRTRYTRLADADWPALEELLDDMARSIAETLQEAGIDREAVVFRRSADMRYLGQGFEITVPLPERLTLSVAEDVVRRFEQTYREKFGHHLRTSRIEALSWRVEGAAAIDWPDVLMPTGDSGGETRLGARRRKAYFPDIGGFVEVPVMDAAGLSAGMVHHGPALVEQPGSTIVIGPGEHFHRDAAGNIRIRLSGETASARATA